jgi:hypothetical protein
MRPRQLWPYDPLTAILAVPLSLIVLALGTAFIRRVTSWPPAELDQAVLLAIILLSLIPLLLMLIDLMAERGARFGFRGLTLDFSRGAPSPRAYAVPLNIGVADRPVYDADTVEIVDALRGSTANEVVVIDLEDGNVWWETRLIVILASALRTGRPAVVVFVATDGAAPGRFEGWASPAELLPLLLRSDKIYQEIYATTQSWVRQWELVPPRSITQTSSKPRWMIGTGPAHKDLLFDEKTGLLNEFGFARLLQSEFGRRIENGPEGPRLVTIGRILEVFRAILRTGYVDETWPAERQVEAVLAMEAEYIPVAHAGRYLRMMTRSSALAGLLRSVVAPTSPRS